MSFDLTHDEAAWETGDDAAHWPPEPPPVPWWEGNPGRWWEEAS